MTQSDWSLARRAGPLSTFGVCPSTPSQSSKGRCNYDIIKWKTQTPLQTSRLVDTILVKGNVVDIDKQGGKDYGIQQSISQSR